ncbi:hypothetical protein [Peptoniphilus harei]|uniref:hypothetical protein n=1 Tax=Peptoniphilus harei TaxID=54005 RepID=UPI0011DDDE57|nr:hypothetical protein [Peptoniphilus harei]
MIDVILKTIIFGEIIISLLALDIWLINLVIKDIKNMNNFQKITQDINSLLDFLVENTQYSREYWLEYLQKEVEYENNN